MSWRRHLRAGLLWACALAGCDAVSPSVVPVAGERGAGSPTDVTGPTVDMGLPAPGARDPDAPRRPPAPRQPGDRGVPGVAGLGGPAAIGPTERAAPPDYGNALRVAFGTPTDCISPASRERLRDRLTVQVSVRATPSGRVTSASVNGAGLSPEDLACMTRRAEALQLTGPIEGAPRTIATSIEYTIASTPGTPGREGGWEADWGPSSPTQGALPAGAQAPGVVTPAIAPPGPAPGAVPPAHTLPAVGPKAPRTRRRG